MFKKLILFLYVSYGSASKIAVRPRVLHFPIRNQQMKVSSKPSKLPKLHFLLSARWDMLKHTRVWRWSRACKLTAFVIKFEFKFEFFIFDLLSLNSSSSYSLKNVIKFKFEFDKNSCWCAFLPSQQKNNKRLIYLIKLKCKLICDWKTF